MTGVRGWVDNRATERAARREALEQFPGRRPVVGVELAQVVRRLVVEPCEIAGRVRADEVLATGGLLVYPLKLAERGG